MIFKYEIASAHFNKPNSLNSSWFIRISLSFMPMNSTSFCYLIVKSSPFLNSTYFYFLMFLKSFSSIPLRISGSFMVANTKASWLFFSWLSSTVLLNSSCFYFICLDRDLDCFWSIMALFCWRQIDLSLSLFYSFCNFRASYFSWRSSASFRALISSVFAISSILPELIKHFPSL